MRAQAAAGFALGCILTAAVFRFIEADKPINRCGADHVWLVSERACVPMNAIVPAVEHP